MPFSNLAGRNLQGGMLAGEEIATLVAEASPFVTAAVSYYGMKVLDDVRDEAAGKTVELGRRLLRRVFGRKTQGESLPAPVVRLVNKPDNADTLAALRVEICEQLEEHADMLSDVRRLLASAPAVTHAPTIHAGRDSYYSGHDMTINRTAD